MRIAIVTAADAKYLPAACCALLSCLRDGEAEAQARLFLLACDVSTEDAKKAHSFFKSRGVPVEIIMISADRFQPFRIDGYVSAATYSRLLLSEFFDDRWDRLLYLDADTRIMVRLQTLLEASLRGRLVGAVHDYLQYAIFGIGDSRARLALRSDAPYFNAGVVCFDWRETIASGLLRQAQAFAIGSAHLCLFHDQDALNKAFEGSWTPLDPRWNLMIVAIPEEVLHLEYPARFRPYISHFAGPIKPWMACAPERFKDHRAWYRDILRDSPWPHFASTASAPPGEITSTSSSDQIKGWFLAQHARLQAAFGRLLSMEVKGAQHPRDPSTAASNDSEVNPELEHLLDLMVAEAANSDKTPTWLADLQSNRLPIKKSITRSLKSLSTRLTRRFSK